jgi:hypothetical protein
MGQRPVRPFVALSSIEGLFGCHPKRETSLDCLAEDIATFRPESNLDSMVEKHFYLSATPRVQRLKHLLTHLRCRRRFAPRQNICSERAIVTALQMAGTGEPPPAATLLPGLVIAYI